MLAYQDTPLETSTRRSWGWLVALIAGIGVVVAAWPLSSWQMRQSVAVESAGPMTCTGSASVNLQRFPDPAYRLVPGMHCRMTYKVTNNAPLTAHLGTATFRLLGTGSGAALHAVGAMPQSGSGQSHTDAVVDLDRDLASGESATFTVKAVFNPRGCYSNGSTLRATSGPSIEVSFLNASGTRTGNLRFALVGTRASDCDVKATR